MMPGASDPSENYKVQTIVEQVQQGNTEAYSELIHIFQRRIYVYCHYLLGNNEEAEDAVQEVLVKGYYEIRRFRHAVSYSAWLYRIAYNHCMNVLKKRKRQRSILQDYIFNYSIRMNDEIDHSEQLDQLLEQLKPEEKHILILKVVEQYTFDEMEVITGIRNATLRKKYERIRKKLSSTKRKGGILHA
ncbi:RNA polymerase sigma factor [Paenibacillus wulumuqiensis]|uniref:RNA polymerase sigma factor n=1 Tax=Paenibacillus wulumuqiensis TaxID=1567107 RepID=UPI000696A225|nr:sigma-70 family RNA polymerase sigma factor [Paenibacillus wulumuqiensis]